MSFRTQRKTYRIGHSRVVTLPIDWCRFYGDRVDVVTMVGSDIIVLAPKGLEDVAQRIVDELERPCGKCAQAEGERS